MVTNTLRPRERKGVPERRERVLDAAEIVFAGKGFDAATVDEVAAQAGVGKGTVYRLVGDKKQLLHALVHKAADSLVAQMTQGFATDDDPTAKLSKILATLCRWYEDHLELGKVLFSAFHPPAKRPAKKARAREEDHHIFRVVQGVFVEGQEKGVFSKTIDPAVAPEVIFHLVTPVFYEELRERFGLSSPQIADRLFELLYAGFAGSSTR